jgi:rRNA-processing protein FCF1
VVDTNTIIDLYCGKLLPIIFRLPCLFVITNLIIHELRNFPFHTLSSMGLRVENLKPDEVKELMEMMGRYEEPSYEDISVLVLAKARNTVLITGDDALRRAAADNSVDCHGTCWLIDYLANQSLISFSEAIAAYDLIRKNRRNPPFDECKALLARWKQRKKLLE